MQSLVDLGGKIADQQEAIYRNSLALSTLIELLVDKGIVDREEFQELASTLDQQSLAGAISQDVQLQQHS